MMIAPAAMFAMFYFLSLFIQQIMGFSPLEAGFAFLPFSFGIVIGAGVASNLVARVDARYLAGTGTLLAATALFMFSRIPVDESPTAVLQAMTDGGADINYWTRVFPFIILMAVGMGLVFVPMTLTAVHHVRAEDSGIGSGVLNTMQQVGGALGLATLSTVALHFTNNQASEVAKPMADAIVAGGGDPTAVVPGTDLTFLETAIFGSSFPEGAVHAFLVASILMLTASAVIWTFLIVKHTELATDAPEGVHVG